MPHLNAVVTILHCVLAIPLSSMKNKAFVQIVNWLYAERNWCLIRSFQSFIWIFHL